MQRAYLIRNNFGTEYERSLVLTDTEEGCVLIDYLTKGEPEYDDSWSQEYVDRFLLELVEKRE